MISLNIDSAEITALKQVLDGNAKEFRKQMAIAVNKVAGNAQKQIAKEVSKEIATPQKTIRETISVKRAKVGVSPTATVTQKKTSRISLREFGAKQNKQGTTYKISKKGGRKLVSGAFQGPKPGVINVRTRGHVFQRVGKERLPIQKLMGPSPWGVTVKRKIDEVVVRFSRADLLKQIKERTRFLGLKKSGAI
jgi:predicted transcriptional regulator